LTDSIKTRRVYGYLKQYVWLAGIDGAVAPLALVVGDYADRVTMVYAAEESYPI
jgi:hypothetical protein